MNTKDIKLKDVVTYENLLRVTNECEKGVLWKDSVIKFVSHKYDRCYILEQKLLKGTYEVSEFHNFTINERGKIRKISSLKFKDRIVNKLMNEYVLKPIFEHTYIYDNAASQKLKGTDFAINRLKQKLRKAYVEYKTNKFYILKCDVKSYFASISHNYVKKLLKQKIKDKALLKLLFSLLDNYYVTKTEDDLLGINLGSETSQTYGLLVLHKIDKFIKEKLHIKYYGRYMDDFYLILNSKERLNEIKKCLEERLNLIGLKFNQNKTIIIRADKGINFLGFHFYTTGSGKIIVKVLHKSVTRTRRKLHKMKIMLDNDAIKYKDILNSYLSWRGHVNKHNNYKVIRQMDNLFNKLFVYDFCNNKVMF